MCVLFFFSPKLHELVVTPGVSLCTIRLAFKGLCAAKDPRAVVLGEILLPQDVNMFTMDIAKSLMLLAPDDRVANILLEQVQRGFANDQGGDDSDSDDFMMNIGGEECTDNSLFALSAFAENEAIFKFLKETAEGRNASLATIAKIGLFRFSSDPSLLETVDAAALSYSARMMLMEAVAGKEPHEAHFREIFQRLDLQKEQEEEERRRRQEEGVANWQPTDEELETWKVVIV